MGDIYYNSTWYLQTFQGQGSSLLHVPPAPNSGIMIHYPPQGTIFYTNNASPGGIQGLTPKDVVNMGLTQGATLIATSISLLTTKGQVLTSDGANNVVVNPGTNGQVLQSDTSASSGLSWIDPAAASGTIAPTPNTIPQRDGTGNINGVGFTASGPILAVGSIPIGTTGTPFANAYLTAATITTLTGTSIVSTGTLTITPTTSLAVTVGTNAFTVTSSGTVMNNALSMAASVPLVIGGAVGVTGTWKIVLNGTSLSFQYCAGGGVYSEMGTFAAP